MKSAVWPAPAGIGTIIVATIVSLSAQADTFLKCVDPATGHTTYTNEAPPRGSQCQRSDGSSVSVIGSSRSSKGSTVKVSTTSNLNSGSTAALVDSSLQKTRDGTRRQVLVDELAAEERMLNEARSSYNNGKPLPLADEGIGSPRYIDRSKQIEKTLRHHERNVASLKQELSNLKL